MKNKVIKMIKIDLIHKCDSNLIKVISLKQHDEWIQFIKVNRVNFFQ